MPNFHYFTSDILAKDNRILLRNPISLDFPVYWVDSHIIVLDHNFPWTGCRSGCIIDFDLGFGELNPGGAVTHDGGILAELCEY